MGFDNSSLLRHSRRVPWQGDHNDEGTLWQDLLHDHPDDLHQCASRRRLAKRQIEGRQQAHERRVGWVQICDWQPTMAGWPNQARSWSNCIIESQRCKHWDFWSAASVRGHSLCETDCSAWHQDVSRSFEQRHHHPGLWRLQLVQCSKLHFTVRSVDSTLPTSSHREDLQWTTGRLEKWQNAASVKKHVSFRSSRSRRGSRPRLLRELLLDGIALPDPCLQRQDGNAHEAGHRRKKSVRLLGRGKSCDSGETFHGIHPLRPAVDDPEGDPLDPNPYHACRWTH